MLTTLLKKIKQGQLPIEHYLETAYPRNHTYKIFNRKIWPKYQLRYRYEAVRRLFGARWKSVVDVGCSKGYFVLEAGKPAFCERSLGIDVHQEDIDACQFTQSKIGNVKAQFKKMQLHELAQSIQDFGGPFQIVLVINTYQYLYFGSEGHPGRYLDHDFIFKNLRAICLGRVIFNNRLDFLDCQQQVKIRADAFHQQAYSAEKIYAAASQYFHITDHGSLGRYPLLALDVK